MDNLDKVKAQAKEVKLIYEDFLRKLSNDEKLEFRASFHLRPTASETCTVVSTLPFAPMRGKDFRPSKIEEALPKLRKILLETDDAKKITMLDELDFKKRKSESFREEDAQAALIRQVIMYGLLDFDFVASEFALFEFGANMDTKRTDVLVYRDSVLFDIELKNKRNGPKDNDIGYSPITQAEGYVSHMLESRNFKRYISCLTELPNTTIGEIKEIRGVALVPATRGKSTGTLEKAARSRGIELWTFEKTEDNSIRINFG